MSISRRQLLAGAGALLVVASCGDDAKPFTVVERYPRNWFVPGKVRLPISIARKDGTLLTSGPATLTGRVFDTDKQVATVTVPIRSKDLVNPYWAFEVRIDQPGSYTLRVDGSDGLNGAFSVRDPAEMTVPYVGSPLAPFDTPTVDDHRGVEPYCTLSPTPCPLHDITLTQALASGKQVGYMVGTPAHCQTGTCGPGLEFLVKSHARLGDKIVMVHADVYADSAATTVAPAVVDLGIDYEPVLYLCAPDGTVQDRIDVIWDQSELDERLDAFLS